MRALMTRSNGMENLWVEEVPEPGNPGPGEVLVAPKAFSLNYRDLLVAEGQYGRPPEGMFIVGSDMAGDVVAVGSGVQQFKVGDKVLNAPITGWQGGTMKHSDTKTFLGGGGVAGVFAERVLFPAEALVGFEKMTYSEAATVPIAGLTAWSAVVTHGKLRPGQTVLCLGTGGVSIYAAQIARSMGAHVIITSSSNEKLDRCKRILGEETMTINYRVNPDWQLDVYDLTNKSGVDVVVETVGGSSLERSIECATYGGRVCVIGLLESTESTISIPRLLSKQVQLLGIYMESVQELRQMVRFIETSKIRPIIDRHFDIEEYKEAYAHLRSGKHFGKIVLELVEGR